MQVHIVVNLNTQDGKHSEGVGKIGSNVLVHWTLICDLIISKNHQEASMQKSLPASLTNTLTPVCEDCDRRMSLVAEKGGKRHLKKKGMLFECEQCKMPEVVFA